MSAAVSISPSGAQGQRARPGIVPLPDKPQLSTLGERINTNTIAIVSGNINAAWLTIAYDLSAVLDNGNDFSVLPVIGRGGEQNVRGSQQDFDRFLAGRSVAQMTTGDRERLFQEFVKWSQTNLR